jgi:beta-glucosidase
MSHIDNLEAFSGVSPWVKLTDEQIEQRSQELLALITLDEKIEMMDADGSFWTDLAFLIIEGINRRTWNGGVISRLNIPGIRFTDGPRGVVMEGATTFPVSMARGATWDVNLEERIGDIIGQELRAHSATLFGGVCVNLLRHPSWGRAQETYGEKTPAC